MDAWVRMAPAIVEMNLMGAIGHDGKMIENFRSQRDVRGLNRS